MNYGVTGPSRELTPDEERLIWDIVAGLPDDAEYISGGAHGVDTAWFKAAIIQHPHAQHRLVLPHAPFNDELISLARLHEVRQARRRARVYIDWAKAGRDQGQCYMNRNDLLVERVGADGELHNFPPTRHEPGNYRAGGGYWATVRRGRRVGAKIVHHPLDEIGDDDAPADIQG
jgi:hypothetical protein